MTLARTLAAAVLAAGVFAASAASAQQYPNHPITLIVPFPPGGATDAIARIIQDPLQKALGQPIVVENIGGAGGMIAADKAAHATPDGYTILIHQVALAAGMTLYNKDLNFDAAKDFIAVGLVNSSASTWAARPDLPANNFGELLRWIRQPGQSVKIGHAGVGSFSHLVGVMIAQELGAKATQVPYRGAGPAMIDLLAGQVDLSSIAAVVAAPLIKEGKLKAYAIIGDTPYSGLPQLKTFGELGYKKLDVDFWHMLLVPTATPRPIIDKINAALRTALADERVLKIFAEGGMQEFPADQETPEAASALLKREIALWGDVIRNNNITGQ
jgi:tripartite-type tricarboxylate transporter receptor subunit TctC